MAQDGKQVTRGKSSLKMEDGTFIIIQLFVVLSVIAGNKAKTQCINHDATVDNDDFSPRKFIILPESDNFPQNMIIFAPLLPPKLS